MPTIKMRDPQGNWVDVYSGGGDTLLDIIDAKIAAACPYKPGDYCISDNGTSPAERWPGTVWAQLPPGTFLTAAGEGYAVGSTGGEAQNVLTANQNGPHQHSITVDAAAGASSATSGSGYLRALTSDIGRISQTLATKPITISGTIEVSGTGAPIENRPPYYATNIWRRTA